MTKEEILKKERKDLLRPDHKSILAAMDEYAKQQAIAFANHLHLNYQPHPEENNWHDHHTDPKGYIKYTSEQLYNQFIESQNK
jgi:hypothetical protein